MKEIEVDCPCCDARLLIDVRTSQVLRHAKKDELDEFGKPARDSGRWDSANEKVKGRKDTATDAFDAALNKERSRTRDLDDLFDRAKSKVDERKERLDD